MKAAPDNIFDSGSNPNSTKNEVPNEILEYYQNLVKSNDEKERDDGINFFIEHPNLVDNDTFDTVSTLFDLKEIQPKVITLIANSLFKIDERGRKSIDDGCTYEVNKKLELIDEYPFILDFDIAPTYIYYLKCIAETSEQAIEYLVKDLDIYYQLIIPLTEKIINYPEGETEYYMKILSNIFMLTESLMGYTEYDDFNPIAATFQLFQSVFTFQEGVDFTNLIRIYASSIIKFFIHMNKDIAFSHFETNSQINDVILQSIPCLIEFGQEFQKYALHILTLYSGCNDDEYGKNLIENGFLEQALGIAHETDSNEILTEVLRFFNNLTALNPDETDLSALYNEEMFNFLFDIINSDGSLSVRIRALQVVGNIAWIAEREGQGIQPSIAEKAGEDFPDLLLEALSPDNLAYGGIVLFVLNSQLTFQMNEAREAGEPCALAEALIERDAEEVLEELLSASGTRDLSDAIHEALAALATYRGSAEAVDDAIGDFQGGTATEVFVEGGFLREVVVSEVAPQNYEGPELYDDE